jgi:hypothetical protein
MKVFLSYAAEDKALARDLATRLNADGFDVWAVDQEVFPGENFALKIGKALVWFQSSTDG